MNEVNLSDANTLRKQLEDQSAASRKAEDGASKDQEALSLRRELHSGDEGLGIIQKFAVSLLLQNSLEDLVWDIARNAGNLLGFEHCVVYLRDGQSLIQMAAYGIKNPDAREILNPIRIEIGSGITGNVAMTKVGENIPDTENDSRYIFDEFSGRSELTVPILFEGETIGVLDSEASKKNFYTDSDLQLFQSLANVASPRISAAIRERELIAARKELLSHKQELELRVRERTQQLSETVSALRQRDSRLQQTQDELKNERDSLKQILESIHDGIMAVNHEGTIQMVSRSAMEILENPICRKGGSVFDLFQQTTLGPSLFAADGSLQEGSGKTELRMPDGNEKLIRFKVKSTFTKTSSEPTHVISIQDITRQSYLEAEAEKAQRLDSLGILAGGIAHDFNNQLAAVSGLVSAAKFTEGEPQEELLDLAEHACMRSKKLTDQLLTLSKSGSPVVRPCSVVETMKDAQLVANAGSSVECKLFAAEDIPRIEADPGQIMQVFENILINAQQAMAGQGRIQIIIEPKSVDGNAMVQISIEDDGPGIEKSDLAKIFDPYFSTKSKGHGLGLTTSFAIIQRHGGQIHVESEPEQGTTFRILLPATSSLPINSGKPDVASKEMGLRILILDDDDLVRKSVATLITMMGHQVVATAEGNETIREYVAASAKTPKPFDIVFLDLTIVGGLGGLETMKRIRKLDDKVPIVVMSGYFGDPVISKYREYGFDDYLKKPFNERLIREMLERVCARKNPD